MVFLCRFLARQKQGGWQLSKQLITQEISPPARLWQMNAAELARFREQMQGSPTPMALYNRSRRFVDVNQAACDLLGRTREEVLQLSIDDCTAPEAHETLPERWARLNRSGWLAGSTVLLRGDGVRCEMQFVATADIAEGVSLGVWHAGRELSEPGTAGHEPIKLSSREIDVLRMLATGAGTQEIADDLVIGTETVKTHVARIVRKLEARNRTHAVAIALARGILRPVEP
jgi:PAS domain S-box-containing protein